MADATEEQVHMQVLSIVWPALALAAGAWLVGAGMVPRILLIRYRTHMVLGGWFVVMAASVWLVGSIPGKQEDCISAAKRNGTELVEGVRKRMPDLPSWRWPWATDHAK